jgi:hypothetical protein
MADVATGGMNAKFFSARESTVTVESEVVSGLQSLEYKVEKNILNVYGTGSDEKQGVDYGLLNVTGKLKVKTVSPKLDSRLEKSNPDEAKFTINAVLKRGSVSRNLVFNECYLTDREFNMDINGVPFVTYSFTCKTITGDK